MQILARHLRTYIRLEAAAPNSECEPSQHLNMCVAATVCGTAWDDDANKSETMRNESEVDRLLAIVTSIQSVVRWNVCSFRFDFGIALFRRSL